jgi:anaerobic selenocysteine-containing dehydrogenase
VVIDPYRTGTAEKADMHLALRPGTDAALACAVMHVAFRDGRADLAYLAAHTDNPAGLRAHLASRGPEWASAITGLSVTEIEAFAALYTSTKRAYIRVGYGFSRSRNGSANVHAVTCLPSVTGAWQYEGGGALWNQRGLYHIDKTLIEGLDALDPSTRSIDMSRIGAALTGEAQALCGGGPVRAMLIQNTNPAVVAPASHLVRRGLLREDLFVAVHEHFMTETAKLADIVLPATMFVEHDDFYQAGGHTYLQLGPKLVEPPGACRSNHELLQDLAHRLGAKHRGFEMSAREMVDETLRVSGWPGFDALKERRWVDAKQDFAKQHFISGFGFPDGRFRFAADWAALGPHHHGMPSLPDHFTAIDNADHDHPFRLVTAPSRSFLNTSFTESAKGRAREGRPTALMHPDDAKALGVADGERVRLGNAQGDVVVHAKLSDGSQPGVVIVEGIWLPEAFEGGVGINVLISDAPAMPAGGAVFHDTAIWVRPMAAEMALAAD